MRQLAKLAALKARKKFAHEEAQLERCCFESEQKNKQLQLEKEVAMTLAELAVYEQFEAEESRRPDIPLASCSSPLPFGSSIQQSSLICHTKNDVQSHPCQLYTQPPPGIHGAVSCDVDPQLQSVCNLQSLSHTAAAFRPYVPPPVVGWVPSQHVGVRPPIMSAVVNSQQSVVANGNSLPMQTNMYAVPNINTGPDNLSQALPHISNGIDCAKDHHSGNAVVDSFSEALKRTQLPKLELSVYDGNAIEFQQWLMSFENIIEAATSEPAKRLHYLMQYTSGSAKTLVSGYALNQTEAGYNAAKAELVKEAIHTY